MEKQLLDGHVVSKEIRDDLKNRVFKLKEQGITPCLATILVGDNSSSETYVKMKGNACEKIGMKSIRIHLPEQTTTEELLEQIQRLNDDTNVHGILLQHPVPEHIDERLAFETISLEKDVDGVTSAGYGQTALGFGKFPSCTPAAIMEMIHHYQIKVSGKFAVVVGRSPILGKPVSAMLLNEDATVTTCHSYTENLPSILKQADIVIAAVGKPNFIKGEWLKEGVIVLDAGYNKGNVGDVDFDSCYQKASAITPVPGGVGPVTITMLLKQTVIAAEEKLNTMNQIA
ncbi:bifunctional 5,10-methylenetetrahydrofolate dehydrogenase/5,10-methenyltetrahydrofolate cyclohydrolase [Alkalihalobacillus pseudalcaliphilus]|uniref:bifunctional 5,10-methylenetetrahydrofolate dehydrogenase/5,10-methenyltetrahydrofolate cyclohydrolase n=1 Tax=Alkalihalobacillus pseudalcaliphilus TaxID=79884 RepID=UPI00064DCF49|nr:tetrahydrofolate dehydrogenase/cyclohydrolase catalytic domain-containing protein [Alkalihalobacillus pseudalcaliphilus]KMK78127.1 5,10-methylene-tetrahydrofolate cyclohydrolase [Alkalihalobacillus pseudalcaliphilus]